MLLAMNLPPCGSSLNIYRYVGDGVHIPTIAWVKDDHGQFWKFAFNCPAELSDIPPDDFDEQREIFMSRNAKQKQLKKDQEQDDSSFSSTNRLMENEKPSGETRQQNFEGSSSSSSVKTALDYGSIHSMHVTVGRQLDTSCAPTCAEHGSASLYAWRSKLHRSCNRAHQSHCFGNRDGIA